MKKSCVAACLESVRMTAESVSGCAWNECPDQRGITVRMCVEWVSESAWNPQLATREKIRFFPQRILGLDFHAWLKFTGLGQTRWLSDQSTPVLDTGKYRKALSSGRIQRRAMFQQVLPDGVIWPDGSSTQIDALIFATGFRPNQEFLAKLPVVDRHGRTLQRNGMAIQVPGLYFVGLPKQRNFASATLRGVGADAAYLMPRLLEHLSEGRLPHLSTSPRTI